MYFAEETHEPIIDPLTFKKVQEIIALRRERSNVKENPANHYAFSGQILCSRCGKNYRRVTKRGRAAWNCPTFIHYGKNVCPAKQIPEPVLFSLTAEVLGLEQFDETAFISQIKQMRVPEANRIIYIFRDGHEVEAIWQDRSRRTSWSDEAKKQARERTLAQQRGDLI